MATHDDLRANAVLRHLPAAEFDQLAEQLEITDVAVRQSVYEKDAPIRDVYFPLDSVFSLIAVAGDRDTVEVATIGREGMVGLPVFLGALSTPHTAFCQVEGRAGKISSERFRQVINHDGALHRALNRLTQSMMVQIAQNVVCNAAHPAGQRAARWLLTTHDRIGRDEFSLTQDFLAQMLGIRRPTTSEIAGRLQRDGLIRYARGQISITDRPGLEEASCDCYRLVREDFEQLTQGRYDRT